MTKKHKGQKTPQTQRGQNEAQLSPKERHANWTKSKLERAALDGYNVIRQETKDVALLINLAGGHDNIMKYLRLNVGLNPKITMDKFNEIIRLSNEAKEKLNEVNALAYELAGKKYIPPRGMKNPLKAERQTQTGTEKSPKKQNNKATKADTAENASAVVPADAVAEELEAEAVAV